MAKTIRLKIKKELTQEQEKQVIRLKGALIAKGFTDIIHISDESEQHYINSFQADSPDGALDFIAACKAEGGLADAIWVL